jgi:phage I-like protein
MSSNPGCDSGRIVCEIAEPVPVPGRVLIIPWGNIQSETGDFIVDAESARLIVAAIGQQRVEIPFDFEHQTLGGQYSSPTGLAPAGGWVKSLEVVPNFGIYAHVEWTPRAAQAISQKEYRYLSPCCYPQVGEAALAILITLVIEPAWRNPQRIALAFSRR